MNTNPAVPSDYIRAKQEIQHFYLQENRQSTDSCFLSVTVPKASGVFQETICPRGATINSDYYSFMLSNEEKDRLLQNVRARGFSVICKQKENTRWEFPALKYDNYTVCISFPAKTSNTTKEQGYASDGWDSSFHPTAVQESILQAANRKKDWEKRYCTQRKSNKIDTPNSDDYIQLTNIRSEVPFRDSNSQLRKSLLVNSSSRQKNCLELLWEFVFPEDS